jgi:hypothetical protein
VSASGSHVRIELLSEEESLNLLAHNSFVGRLGFVVDDGLPMVMPVNYGSTTAPSSSVPIPSSPSVSSSGRAAEGAQSDSAAMHGEAGRFSPRRAERLTRAGPRR